MSRSSQDDDQELLRCWLGALKTLARSSQDDDQELRRCWLGALKILARSSQDQSFSIVLHCTQFVLNSASTEVTKSEDITQKSTSAATVKTTSSMLPPTQTQTTPTTKIPATKIPLPTFTRPHKDSGTLPDYIHICPSNVECNKLGGDCIDCEFNINCYHGRNVSVTCHPKWKVVCKGSENFTRWFKCGYCYQTPHWQHRCMNTTQCQVLRAPQQRYQANCTVTADVICLGRRQFYKMMHCNWTSGKRWTTALALRHNCTCGQIATATPDTEARTRQIGTPFQLCLVFGMWPLCTRRRLFVALHNRTFVTQVQRTTCSKVTEHR
ncbi:hypothetical protein LSAT2_011707 [Lamellibrachia satsuma]|nr:hypothetical protein LSAT2_011707 [Lamellibrachia satsuma]